MTDDTTQLRRALLLQASAGLNRDAILRACFPQLDNDTTRQLLDEAHQARLTEHYHRSEQIIADLIRQDKEARHA